MHNFCLYFIIYIIYSSYTTGYPPFSEERREKLVNHIKSGQYVFHEQYWKDVSTDAKDFIKKLLVVDPSLRMSADDCLSHPWVCCICLSVLII